MKSSTANQSRGAVQADADRLADFVLFTQRSCILNLSNELNRGNISFPQFFLLAYLSSEDYLTMSDIAKKMGHSTAAATGLVDRLEKLGYVERVHARNFVLHYSASVIGLCSQVELGWLIMSLDKWFQKVDFERGCQHLWSCSSSRTALRFPLRPERFPFTLVLFPLLPVCSCSKDPSISQRKSLLIERQILARNLICFVSCSMMLARAQLFFVRLCKVV